MRRALISSQAFKASWIFHTTPADRVALAASGPVAIGLLCLAPMLLVVAAILAFWFGNAMHGLVHTAVLGLLCYIGLQIDVLLFPGLPFASPPTKHVGAKEIFGLSMFAPVFGILAYHFAIAVMYQSAARVAILLAGFAAISRVLSALTRWRVRRRSAAMEYDRGLGGEWPRTRGCSRRACSVVIGLVRLRRCSGYPDYKVTEYSYVVDLLSRRPV